MKLLSTTRKKIIGSLAAATLVVAGTTLGIESASASPGCDSSYSLRAISKKVNANGVVGEVVVYRKSSKSFCATFSKAGRAVGSTAPISLGLSNRYVARSGQVTK